MNQATVFLSNRLEHLASHLKENLFTQGSHPFSKRIVIVPSQAIEKWIRLFLAQDPSQGIAAGFETLFLNEALKRLLTPSFEESFSFFPSDIERLLQIESLIAEIQKKEFESPQWKSLVNYLGDNERKRSGLCRQLNLLFRRYEVYGTRCLIQWKKNPMNWQQALWSRLNPHFCEANPLSQKLQFPQYQDYSLHLFAFSHLSALHFTWFKHLAANLPVFFYQISPCQEFWSDVRSDWEAQKLLENKKMPEKSREYLEELLQDRHPLLANMGKVGREFSYMIEESECPAIESYDFPGHETQLKVLQSSILMMEKNVSESTLPEDGSLQFHLSTTPHREIQNLHNTLLSLVIEKNIEPKEIIVMAPDITIYAPFIQAVFGQTLDFQIMDMPLLKNNRLINGVLKILELDQKRWSAPAVMSLFNHLFFRTKMGWKEKDIELMYKWIEKAEIRWGLNLEHRNELLRQSHCEKDLKETEGTWEQGLGRLLKSFASTQEIEFTQAELLGECILLLTSLKDDLDTLKKREEAPLKEWISFLKELVKRYFCCSEEETEAFFRILSRLEHAGKNLLEKCYSFFTFQTLFEELLASESVTLNSRQLNAVCFCSLLPMRAIPAKVICLLGMNDGVFPRNEKLQDLDLLRHESLKDYYPSRNDFDRYLFLEAILSARENLIFSALTHSVEDFTEIPLSPVILEVLSLFPQKQIVTHPMLSYDRRYFDGSNPHLKNFSKQDFEISQSLLQQIPAPKSSLFLTSVKREVFEAPPLLDIADLAYWVRNPLRNYFQKMVGISLQCATELKEEEEFTLSPLEALKIQKMLLGTSLEATIKKQKGKGNFPSGPYESLAGFRIRKQQETFLQVLKENGLQVSSLHTIVLDPHLNNASADENSTFWFPPLEIAYEMQKKVLLVGRIDKVISGGLFTFEKEDLRGAIRAWPEFLLINSLPYPQETYRPRSLFFGKEGGRKECFFESGEEFLKILVKAYFDSFNLPPPIPADWMEPLLKKDAKKLRKKIEECFTLNYEKAFDREWRWMFRNRKSPEAEELIEIWFPWAHLLYGEMQNAWF